MLTTYPLLILRCLDRGGAARLWMFAKMLEKDGCGWVDEKTLRQTLSQLGLNSRTYSRWMAEALKCGMVRGIDKGRVWLAAPHAVAKVNEIDDIGKRATITCEPQVLLRKGWRKIVWAAYLTTTREGGLCSQKTKEDLTGVSTRRQRNYQKNVGTATQNYCDRGEGTPEDAAGWRECFGLAVFEKDGKLVQRLPDSRSVPADVAVKANVGRAKKEQSRLMASCNNAIIRSSSRTHRGNVGRRLFFSAHDSAERAARRMGKEDIPAYKRSDTFAPVHEKCGKARKWEVVR